MADLTGDMESSYQNLIGEIEQTINKNEQLFKDMKSAKYVQSKSYESDLKNYKMNKEIEDIAETRKEIWDTLDKKYNDNTKLRKFYFDELVNLNKQLQEQYKQLNRLVDEVNKMETENSTLYRKIKKDKYDMSKHIYYAYMYKILIVIQLLCCIVLGLGLFDIIPKYTCLVVIFIMLIGCLVFMIYYALIANAGRDQFSWDRYRAKDISARGFDSSDKCGKKVTKSKKKTSEELQLEEDVKEIIADSKMQGGEQCK